jgi:hypothetical protein
MATWSDPPTTGNCAASWDIPGPGRRHAACDAQIAALQQMAAAGALLVKHLRVITEALNFTVANLPYEVLKVPYREALSDIEEGIAKYGDAIHNEPPEVRYVSSSDSAASGDEISR